jgi:ComF family protein
MTEAVQGESGKDGNKTEHFHDQNVASEPPAAVTETVCCLNCTELQPFFDEGISLFAFTDVGRAFVHTLKYHNGTWLRADLQRLFVHEKVCLEDLKYAVFVPVPLHFFRKWKRGYNQSDLIANALAKHVGGQVQRLLRRKRHTPSQTSLTKAQRKENVRCAFGLRRFAKIDMRATYVLTDDVFTTGSTLNECARVLKENGATVVRVFTLAHG